MSKPTLTDLAPRYQAQIRQQLRAVPHPRTVAIEQADDTPAKADPLRFDPFMRALGRAGIPLPVVELKFSATRRWRFDFAWPSQMVALEVEGGIWTGGRHTRGAGFLKDMEKYNAAALAGWRVFRCTPQQLATAQNVQMVKEAIVQSSLLRPGA